MHGGFNTGGGFCFEAYYAAILWNRYSLQLVLNVLQWVLYRCMLATCFLSPPSPSPPSPSPLPLSLPLSPSPLPPLQEGVQQLERQLKKICTLCEERQALAEKDRQCYNRETTACHVVVPGINCSAVYITYMRWEAFTTRAHTTSTSTLFYVMFRT